MKTFFWLLLSILFSWFYAPFVLYQDYKKLLVSHSNHPGYLKTLTAKFYVDLAGAMLGFIVAGLMFISLMIGEPLSFFTQFPLGAAVMLAVFLWALTSATCRFLGAYVGAKAHGNNHLATESAVSTALQFAFYGRTSAPQSVDHQPIAHDDYLSLPDSDEQENPRPAVPQSQLSSLWMPPKVDLHWLKHYLVFPLLTGGFTTMLAFGLFGNGIFANYFFMDGVVQNLLFAISCASIGFMVMVQWLTRHAKAAVLKAPVDAALEAVATGQAILAKKQAQLGVEDIDILVRCVLDVRALLQRQDRDNMLCYDQIDADWQVLNTMDNPFVAEGVNQYLWVQKHMEEIGKVFDRIAAVPATAIDSDYRPPLAESSNRFLPLLSAVLLAIGTGVLCFLFTDKVGLVSTVNAGWTMSLAAVLVFFAWIGMRHFLNHSSSGPYGEWAAIFGLAATTLLTLTLVLGLTGGFPTIGIPSVTLSLIGVAAGIALLATVLMRRRAYAYVHSSNRLQIRSSRAYEIAAKGLTVFKLAIIVGLLILAFLSIATMLNVSAFNLDDNGVANFFAIKAMSIGGSSAAFIILTLQWLSIFSVAILAISSVIAFILILNLLKRSARSVADFKKYDKATTVWALTLKISFSAVIVTMLTFLGTNDYTAAGIGQLSAVFLLVNLFMPLFSGNANSILGDKFTRWFNRYLGVSIIVGNKRFSQYITREITVLAMLSSSLLWIFIAAHTGTFPLQFLSAASMVLGLSTAITMLFRWEKIIRQYKLPILAAPVPSDALLADEKEAMPLNSKEESKHELLSLVDEEALGVQLATNRRKLYAAMKTCVWFLWSIPFSLPYSIYHNINNWYSKYYCKRDAIARPQLLKRYGYESVGIVFSLISTLMICSIGKHLFSTPSGVVFSIFLIAIVNALCRLCGGLPAAIFYKKARIEQTRIKDCANHPRLKDLKNMSVLESALQFACYGQITDVSARSFFDPPQVALSKRLWLYVFLMLLIVAFSAMTSLAVYSSSIGSAGVGIWGGFLMMGDLQTVLSIPILEIVTELFIPLLIVGIGVAILFLLRKLISDLYIKNVALKPIAENSQLLSDSEENQHRQEQRLGKKKDPFEMKQTFSADTVNDNALSTDVSVPVVSMSTYVTMSPQRLNRSSLYEAVKKNQEETNFSSTDNRADRFALPQVTDNPFEQKSPQEKIMHEAVNIKLPVSATHMKSPVQTLFSLHYSLKDYLQHFFLSPQAVIKMQKAIKPTSCSVMVVEKRERMRS